MGEFTEPITNPTAQPALTKEDLATTILRGGAQISGDTVPDQLHDLGATTILPALMNHVQEVQNPQRMSTIEPMTPEWQAVMQKQAADKMAGAKASYESYQRLVGEVGGMWQQDPGTAAQVLGSNFWQDLKDQALNVGRTGVGALNFLLKNLDRGRGSVMEYAQNIQNGASQEDAQRRAYDVLRGSDRGWVLTPEKMGPSGAEFLRGMGYDDSLTTSAEGLALDVAVDPLNLLGIGFSRKGLRIGAHQILNEDGRQLWLQSAQRIANGLGFEEVAHAPYEVQQVIQGQAHAEMRQLINGSDEAAHAYLDMGGLKIAGMTLINAPLKTDSFVRNGKVIVSRSAQSLAQLMGSTALDAVDAIGKWSIESALPMPQRMRKFMELLPSNLREAGQNVALLLNRTNPLAGEDYRLFKQAEYYDRIGFQRTKSMNALQHIFGTFDPNQLEMMTWSIEKDTVEQLPQEMQTAIGQFKALTDASLIEEVQRGIMRPEWSPERRARFIDWMTNPNAPVVNEAELQQFLETRIPRYVPHIYRNVEMAKKLSVRYVGPRAPSIVEGFTERRLVPTLEEAQQRGLTPELNLFALGAYRLASADQAIVTYDFLKHTAEEFGEVSPKYVKQQLETAAMAGDAVPYYTAQHYMDEQTTRSGMLVGDAARHLEIAREIARQPNVPAELVAKLDDAAKREFLTHRFKTVNPGTAEKLWQKYVVRPTEKGYYNGPAVAPGVDALSSAAAARELHDPLYGAWSYLSVGGKGDPAVLNRLMLPDPIVRDIERLKARTMPPEMLGLLRLTDPLNFWWKMNVTLPFPAFHFRNKLTNILNSSLEASLGVFTDRPTMYNVLWGNQGTLRTELGTTVSYEQLRQEMMRHGVMLGDYHRADIGDSIEEMMRMRIGKGKNVNRIPLPGGDARLGNQSLANPLAAAAAGENPLPVMATAMREGAAMIENSDRMLVYIASRKRGMSPEEAADRVSRVLFDWQDISNFEKSYVRRIIPFYTWARKNIALQAGVAATQPTRLALFEKIRHNFSQEDPNDPYRSAVERDLMPQAMHDEMGLRLDTAQGVSRWLMGFQAPINDLDKVWAGSAGATLKAWLLQFNPVMQEVMESAIGEDFFTGKKRLEFGANDKVYPMMLNAPEPIKRWLGVHEVVSGDDTSVRVEGDKYRKLMVGLMMSGMSRMWSTAGNVTDPNVSLSARLFQLLTGGRIRKFNADSEVAKRTDRMLRDPDQGLVPRLTDAARQLKLQRMLHPGGQSALEDATDKRAPFPTPQDISDELRIQTPIYPNELDEQNGIHIP